MRKHQPVKIGERFTKLTVIEYSHNNKYNRRCFKCICDCGGEKIVEGAQLRKGNVKSCGCMQHAPKYKTRSVDSLYRRWNHIKQRCYNPKNTAYKNYGGRGIHMCDEWLSSFSAFEDWALKNGYKEELSIDRVDVNGNYCPENCRWADDRTQANNKRDNSFIEYCGLNLTKSQWEYQYGIKGMRINTYIAKRNMSPVEAVAYIIQKDNIIIEQIENHPDKIIFEDTEHIFLRAVIQMDLEGNVLGSFNTLAEAGRALKLNPDTISLCCRGMKSSYKGFTFKFSKNYSEREYRNNTNEYKPISQFSLKGEWIRDWDNINLILKEYNNISSSNIQACCAGRRLSAGGFKWSYVDTKVG